ncbi:hypothetical protein ACJX0J_005097, partial (mitochondrion) [Zea mays]
MARSFFLSITSGWSRMHKTDMGTGVEAKKKKIYILILFLGGILRIGKRCGFLCSDSNKTGRNRWSRSTRSEEDSVGGISTIIECTRKPMAFLYSKELFHEKSITKRRLGSSC